MTASLTIYFVRHGEVHNPDDILYGQMPDFHLSETGREQASEASQYLTEKPLVAIYSSPMERAQETANILKVLHLDIAEITLDERLIEVHTPYDGRKHEELEAINHDLYAGNEPPYEQPRDIRKRVLSFIADMREKHANESIAVVTHGDIVVSVFMYTHGADENDIGRDKDTPNRIQSMGLPDEYPATASISRITYKTDDPDEVPEYHYIKPY